MGTLANSEDSNEILHFQAQLLIIFVAQMFIWKFMVKNGYSSRQ